MEVGTGATAAPAGHTTLVTDRGPQRADVEHGRAADVLTIDRELGCGRGTTATIPEAGVFNAASAGTMYSRATFTAINKGAADTLQITWT